MNFEKFDKFYYFGINVTAYTNDEGEIKKKIKCPADFLYKDCKHYFKPIYNKETKENDIIPNGISIITKDLSTIDVDDINKCEILDKLLIDCSFIIKTRKGYHFYFNKENVLERHKLCGIADINLKTLYYVPSYYHNETKEEFKYTIYKNDEKLVDMPQYAIDWCNNLINITYGEKKELRRVESDEGIANDKPKEILYQILDGLNSSRFNNYKDWFIIACVFVNEKFDLKIFDQYSKKCKGYNKQNNDNIINNLKSKSNGYRIASLYYMLKQDNYDLWEKLQSERSDFWYFMETFNHYDIALIYYQLYPNKYIFSNNTWYSLNNYNIYQKLNDFKDFLFNNITTTIQQIIIEQRNLINPADKEYLNKNKMVKKNFNNIGNSTFKKGILEALAGLYYIDNIESKLNDNINLIAFEDKVFDIKLGQYRNITPSDYISMTVGYKAPTYDIIDKHRENVNKLLYSIFEDKEIVEYWFKTIGLSMFGNKSESLYIHTGTGRNGKGLLGNILEKCLGSYYQQADSNLLTGDSKSATNSTLANAKYTRLLVLSEPDDTDDKTYKLKTSLVKSITGGDTITVRDLYKSNISFKPKFNVILQCNKKPDIDKLDVAIEQRLKVIHYPFTFVHDPSSEIERKIDTNLKETLIKDEEFIKSFIGLLLDYAYKNYNSNTILEPLKIKEQNNLYFDENNPVKEFLSDCCEITKDSDKIKTRDLFYKYIECNVYKNIDEKKFNDLMINLNKIKKVKIDGCFYYKGLKFIDFKKKTDENNEF